ncbi:hypothetical protein JMJ56_22415 [Belnapia sp. T18]|uniref:Uncharacterized protein n=1 Tax=Belnapia arida TaxID=2804533 RepID=A0ABS1U7Y5_9PROT|nr:hypothetical protein [Belnapia arida]MBL6080774.1 hypothetical protein [Belnapia arida]
MEWIDKHHLDGFAEKTDAQDKLPRLVADLILATSAVPDVMRFLSDGAGRVRGFDGVLVSPGAPPHVPRGRSYWEFGCSRDVRDKARRDIRKRKGEVDDTERAASTLVFVTPRHYDTPGHHLHDFEEELRAESGWGAVLIVDGGRLRHWLALASGVAARWARLEFQAAPQGVWSVEEFWHEYSNRFDPPLKEEVILAGRQQQATQMLERLAALQPDRIVVSADSPDEALAFAMAALRKADPAVRLVLEARSLVVDTPEAARDLRDRPLAYFPTHGAARSVGSLAQWGPTILARGRNDAAGGAIDLRRPSRHDFAEALQQPRIPLQKALQLASECGRSVTVLARRIPGIDHPSPAWAATPDSLLPALLAGAWDAATPADRAVVARLAGVADYGEWEARAQPFLAIDDPPLENEGTVWKVRAPVDAFVLLGRHLGAGHFERLRQACLDVLGLVDANLDKTSADLMMAGPGVPHSDWLRDGLATTLLMTATLHNSAGCGPALATAGGPERWADATVAALPGLATDARLLASLRGTLPILAEAAPIPFVAAIERLVAADPEGVRWLFVERTEFITPRSYHVHLLWALERIAWDPAVLPQAALLLARLAALDPHPDSMLINRPVRSLRSILLPWLPGTDADLEKCLGVLTAIIRTSESVGWELCMRLLPEHHAVAEPTARPRLREASSYDHGPSRQETAKMWAAVANHVLGMVGTDPERWITLLDRIEVLSSEDQARATQQLEAVFAATEVKERRRLWEKLRDIAARHAEFPDAGWTLKGERLEVLAGIVRRFAPSDSVSVAAPLFDFHRPSRHRALTEEEMTAEALEEARGVAVADLLSREGSAGLLRLAEAVRAPWLLAAPAVLAAGTPEAVLDLCGTAQAARTENSGILARALSGSADRTFGDAWRELLARAAREGRTPEQVANLALGLEDGPGTWDFVDRLSDAVANSYWRGRHPWRLAEGDSALNERAASQYLSVGRPYQALTTLAEAARPAAALVFEALDGTLSALNSGPLDDPSMLSFHLEQVFDGLRARDDVNRTDLARREFAYLPLLGRAREGYGDLAILHLMAADPTMFVDAVKLVFRGASEEPRELNQAERNLAKAAYDLLAAFRTVPGVTANGVNGEVTALWVREAMRRLREADREAIGAQCVGKVLAHAPHDLTDGAWPASPVRDLIEEAVSDDLETGIRIERFNMRGVHLRGLYDGGDQERQLAAAYRGWADACTAWPRTSAMLASVAADWLEDAKREDVRARQRMMED